MIKITGGIYLIADLRIDAEILIHKLCEALNNGISIVQLYNLENCSQSSKDLLDRICRMCHQFEVPVLVNNNWNLLNDTLLDGVHFDRIPEDFELIKKTVHKKFLKGITCSNDLSVVRLANKHQFDYLSFCSMFQSPSATQCEIVASETVRKARLITDIPIFLAGGINLDNIKVLSDLPIDGLAVISGIMSASDTSETTQKYISELHKIIDHEN